MCISIDESVNIQSYNDRKDTNNQSSTGDVRPLFQGLRCDN